MTTVGDFIRDTLGLLQVVDGRQPVKAEDMELGIRFLNRLVERIEANSIATGWSPVESPSDDLPLPLEAELGVMYSLAMTLAPQFGVTPLQTVAVGAANFMGDLSRDQAVATPVRPILDVPAPDRYAGDSTLTGTIWYS